jgi:hypothetical protein
VSLLPVVPAGASFKPLGTTIFLCSASLLHIFAPLPSSQPPHVFSENFTRTQFPHFSPHPGFTIKQMSNKKKSALAPLLRLGSAAVETDHV